MVNTSSLILGTTLFLRYLPLLLLVILERTWQNGVGLCWEATRQGITRRGRVNGPAGPWRFDTARDLFHHSLVLPYLRKSEGETANQRPSADNPRNRILLVVGYAALG